MLTDLLAIASGVAADRLAVTVPPSCQGPVEMGAPLQSDAAGGILGPVEWSPRRPARHLLPALSLLAGHDRSFRFEVAGRIEGEWTPWVAATTIGAATFPAMAAAAGPLEVDVDVLAATRPVERVRLRVRIRPPEVLASPWLLTLSACDLEPAAAAGQEAIGSRWLAVPPLSQMEEPPALRQRICSPTCVAMVLGYLGVPVPVAHVAAQAFHPGLDLYGVWPAAIDAAARHGVPGYLLRFPDWDSAVWCMARGLPVIASVRYAAGELSGAAVSASPGHLIVLTGSDGEEVLVNDPAAPTRDGVARRYRLDEIRRVWLDRAGVGYVLFPP